MSDQQSLKQAGSRKKLIDLMKEYVGQNGIATIQPEVTKATTGEAEKSINGLIDSSTEMRYVCITEKPLPENFRATQPAKHVAIITGLEVGNQNIIPRWKAGYRTVNFAAYAGGYPHPDDAVFAAYRLNDAAKVWNNANVGVQFKWVGSLADAEFVLAYGGDKGSVLAEAFFPNSNDLNTLFVYSGAFSYKDFMVNFFEHELGHVLGLRHEFAPEKEGGAVQIGPRNPNSVMSYVFPPHIQQSDIDSTKLFYGYTGPSINGLPITDWIPDN